MDVSVDTAPAPVRRLMQNRRRVWLAVLALAVIVVALVVAGWWFFYARFYQSTDDAYVAGDLVTVNSQVSGTVVAISTDETDYVRAGEELVRLDATDGRIALQDAEQQLARTVRQTRTVFANRDQLRAVVSQRRADLARAQADFNRRKNLAVTGAVSGEELGHAQDTLSAARDALTAAEKSLAASLALVRASVRSPVTGYVARRTVQLGQQISPGAPLMAIVPLERLRVDANFKEVQLRRMRIGQPVRVVTDLYGRHLEYHGRVAGLGLGTGAAFALLPAQNATGNWIKVVQRVPVRVTLDPQELREHPLRIGLSTTATVDVRDDSGPVMAQVPRQEPVLATNTYDIDRREIAARIAQIIGDNSREPDGQATEPEAH